MNKQGFFGYHTSKDTSVERIILCLCLCPCFSLLLIDIYLDEPDKMPEENPLCYVPISPLLPPPSQPSGAVTKNLQGCESGDVTMGGTTHTLGSTKQIKQQRITAGTVSVADETRIQTDPGKASYAAPDLCSVLPEDLICRVTSFLDVRSLLRMRHCDRILKDLATRNEAGWDSICRKLWAAKVHVKPGLLSPPADIPSTYYIEAYKQSIADAKDRQYITFDELCYDPETHTGTVWSFRFKESAGSDWTTMDPWYNGLPCRKMVFLRDGSVQQYVTTNSTDDIGDAASDSDSSQIELTRPNFGNLVPLGDENTTRRQLPPGRLIEPPLTMSWRFLTRPMDLPERPFGSYLRFSVGGRDVPTYSIRRSPTGNWGFLMESCWGVYTSFEMPPRQSPRQRRRLRRTEGGARWVEIQENGEETLATSTSSRSAPDNITSAQNDAALMDDESLMITNEIQWREAFLYNVGARVLPEGNNATDDFDRAFRGIDD